MKKYLEYPARITPDGDSFMVVFPDIRGCITEGDSIEEAKNNAIEALSLTLDFLVDEERDFPEPSKLQGNDIYYITADLGKSVSTYSSHHKNSYDRNKDKVISAKREKELALKEQGYKNFKEFLHKDALAKLDKITKATNQTRRDFLTSLIEKEFNKLPS